MSVYYEAVQSGRLHISDYPEIPAHSGKPARRSFKGIRAHLRDVKRVEAEDRNARTPLKRTAHWRRDRANRSARSEQAGGEDRG
jgi:hypothetical protein